MDEDSLRENIDYELIPGNGENWDIRILKGYYTETVIAFSSLRVTEDGENLSFNFEVVSSPIENLNPDSDLGLQKYAGMVLSSILETAALNEMDKSD